MKNKKYRYLTFYKKHLGKLMPSWGLCNVFFATEHWQILETIRPTIEDLKRLKKHGHNTNYWGSGSAETKMGEFTPLRQNLVLLMAALNNEL